MNPRDLLNLAGYMAALGCGTYLASRGHLPPEVIATLLGAAVPVQWRAASTPAKE